MTDRSRDPLPVPARAARPRREWFRLLDAHGDIHGFHAGLGPRHGALFTEDDGTLLVTFEEAAALRRSTTGLPFGLAAAGREGWSQLCLYCEGDTFFRDPLVYGFFDELVDTGFFDHFDRVLFHGAGPCGQAAAAFSVASPGAEVLLVRPLATLAPHLAGWDRRYLAARRADFATRYGEALEMLEAAGRVWVIFDPQEHADAMHAALFAGAGARLLACPNLGSTPERDLAQMDLLVPMLRAAGKGRFDPAIFFRLYRRRHRHAPYLARVLERLRAAGRRGLEERWKRGIITGHAARRPERP